MSANSEIMQELAVLAGERKQLVVQLTEVDSRIAACCKAWYEKNPIPKNKYWFFSEFDIAKAPTLL